MRKLTDESLLGAGDETATAPLVSEPRANKVVRLAERNISLVEMLRHYKSAFICIPWLPGALSSS